MLCNEQSKLAFGKFIPNQPLQKREFEIRLGIIERDSWKSNKKEINRLLEHLGRYTKSESSKEKYLIHINQFCKWSGYTSEKLANLQKNKASFLIQKFVDELASKNRSRAYVNTVIKRLRTFYRVNGYTGRKELTVKGYFLPTRYRKTEEYIPSKAEIYTMADAAGSRRNRAIILS